MTIFQTKVCGVTTIWIPNKIGVRTSSLYRCAFADWLNQQQHSRSAVGKYSSVSISSVLLGQC